MFIGEGYPVFDNSPDYVKMEYTSNRLRKEFLAFGRTTRQLDREGVGGHRLTPWEHLSDNERDDCAYRALRTCTRLNNWRIRVKSSFTY